MSDIFYQQEASALLQNKKLLFMGDSNMRALYKDLLWLMCRNTLISPNALRSKLESMFCGDVRISKSDALTKGRDYTEDRLFKTQYFHIGFKFITRCYSKKIKTAFEEFKRNPGLAPDVLIVGSCLWDITRWGPNGVDEYKQNMVKLMDLFRDCLPAQTLVIWVTALPTGKKIYGGLIVKQIEFLQNSLRFEILEANLYCARLVTSYQFDVLDFQYLLHTQIFRRSCDGVHYLPSAVRMMTNQLLTHICLSWGYKLPGRTEPRTNLLLHNTIELYTRHNEVSSSSSNTNEEGGPSIQRTVVFGSPPPTTSAGVKRRMPSEDNATTSGRHCSVNNNNQIKNSRSNYHNNDQKSSSNCNTNDQIINSHSNYNHNDQIRSSHSNYNHNDQIMSSRSNYNNNDQAMNSRRNYNNNDDQIKYSRSHNNHNNNKIKRNYNYSNDYKQNDNKRRKVHHSRNDYSSRRNFQNFTPAYFPSQQSGFNFSYRPYNYHYNNYNYRGNNNYSNWRR